MAATFSQNSDAPEERWLLMRLWIFLEVPSDVACRAVSSVWADVTLHPQGDTSKAVGQRLLRLPHASMILQVDKLTALVWTATHVDPWWLQTLHLREGRRTGLSTDDLIERVLSKLVVGNFLAWISWLLEAERQGLPALTGGCILRRRDIRVEIRGDVQLAVTKAMRHSTLLDSAGRGSAEMAELFLQDGPLQVHNECDENGCAAIHHAANEGHAQVVKLLLSARAHIDAQDDDDWTPLCLAAESGHIEVCRELLEARADASIPDEDLLTPLWWARRRQHEGVVALLLGHAR